MVLKYLQLKAKHNFLTTGEPTEKQKRQAKLSLIFGAVALPLLFVPYVAVIAIPLAVAGLVLGTKSLKGNSNTQGILGVVFSGTVLFLLILALVAYAVIFSSGIY